MAFKKKTKAVAKPKVEKVVAPKVDPEYVCADVSIAEALQKIGAPLVGYKSNRIRGEAGVWTFAISEEEAKAVMEVR